MEAKHIFVVLLCCVLGALSEPSPRPKRERNKASRHVEADTISKLASAIVGPWDTNASAVDSVAGVQSAVDWRARLVLTRVASARTQTRQAPNATQSTVAPSPAISSGPFVAWVALVGLYACWYKKCGGKDSCSVATPDVTEAEPLVDKSEWVTGLFGCFEYPGLSMFTCLCGPVRWADTVSMAHFLEFFGAILIVVAFYAVDLISGIGSLMLVIIYTYHRQKLRQLYGMPHGDCKTIFSDFLAYLCCPCCAIVQEAVQVETYATDEEKPAEVEKPPASPSKASASTTTCCVPITRSTSEKP